MNRYRFIALCTVVFFVSLLIQGCDHGFRPIEELEDIQRMDKNVLKARLGDPLLSLIDVRYEPNWEKSDRLISGAVREDPMEVGSWIHKYPKDRTIVLYCD